MDVVKGKNSKRDRAIKATAAAGCDVCFKNHGWWR